MEYACAVGGVAATTWGDGVCFALTLEHLHPDRKLNAESITSDAVALVTSLEGQTDARFVLQAVARPDVVQPERGTIDLALLTIVSSDSPDVVTDLCDDLLDLLSAPPLRWSFRPVDDPEELSRLLNPFEATSFAEIARREEPCIAPSTRRPPGFTSDDDPPRKSTSRLWSTWTLGPASADLRRIATVLLAQEAPVCVRIVLQPTAMTGSERDALEQLVTELDVELPEKGPLRTALLTLGSLLTLRPLFEVRCLVASPERLSRSLLSALGHSISEPADHMAPEPVLRGGFAVLRGGVDVDDGVLDAAYRDLAVGQPTPTLGDPALVRLRRLMGPREAANLFRIPVADDDRFPGIDTLAIPDLEPPVADLPLEGVQVGSLIGHGRLPVKLDAESRFRHTYVVGQTGTGKSTLLMQMALQDIAAGDGVAVLDPHGDLVEDLLARIPEDRIDDVVLLDPADPVAVVGVNLLEAESQVQAAYLIEELSHMFQTLFDPNQQGIIGPRYVSMLRQAARLLMSNPDTPSSMLDIATVYGDPAVRSHLVNRSNDPMALEYWATQATASKSNDHGEILAWFSAKFDAFRASDLVRHVVGQATSTISFSEILRDRRILLVNLSKGLLGTYNSSLIGYVVFTRLWAAALERAAIPRSDRAPFHVYIDEFQNMTSQSLPTVLSEARKFNMSLTLANQFFSQVPSETREAIMGNTGSRMTLRLGPKDAGLFREWMGADVRLEELMTLPNHVGLASMSRQGRPLEPFAFRTVPPAQPPDINRSTLVREQSRRRWARPVGELDEEFALRWAGVPGSFAQQAHEAQDSTAKRRPRRPRQPSFIDDWLTKDGTPAAQGKDPDGS